MPDDKNHYCFQCCAEVDPDIGEYCHECGKKHSVHYHQSYELPAGTYLRDNRYFVGRSIGTGGFGISYVGYDVKLNKKILIKEVYYSDYCTRNVNDRNNKNNLNVKYSNMISVDEMVFKAKQECRNLAEAEELDNVVKIYDWFLENNTAYIIMEFINGCTLFDRINSEGNYTWDDLYPKIEPLIKSLACLHEKGIIHRDIKPKNIMIKKVFHNEEKFVLIDFGLARFYNQMTTGIAYTPCYSPEEQRTRSVEDGFYTDVYSLAATIYYALTGINPQNKNSKEINEIFPELGCMTEKYGVPSHVVDALSYALISDFNSRCQSMEEFLDLLSPKKVKTKPSLKQKSIPDTQQQSNLNSLEQSQQKSVPKPNLNKKEQPQQKPVPKPNLNKKEQPQQKPVPKPNLSKKEQPQQKSVLKPNLSKKEQPQQKPVPKPNLNKKEQPQPKANLKKQPCKKRKSIPLKYIILSVCLCIFVPITCCLIYALNKDAPQPPVPDSDQDQAADINNIQFKEDVINVFINRNQSIEIDYSPDEFKKNDIHSRVAYTSDDETIAAINKDGIVRGKNLGSTTVHLKYDGKKTIIDECIVNVVDIEQLQKNIYNDYLNEIVNNCSEDDDNPVNSIIKDFDNEGNLELAIIYSSGDIDVFQIKSNNDKNFINASKDDVEKADEESDIYNYAVYQIKQVDTAESDSYILIDQEWDGKISYDLLSDDFVDEQKQRSVYITSDNPDIISVEDNTELKANKIGSTFLTVKTDLNSAACSRIRADVSHTEDGKKLVEYSNNLQLIYETGCTDFPQAKLIGKKFDYFYDYNAFEYIPTLLLRYDYGKDVKAIHFVRVENDEIVHYAAYDSANDFIPYKEKNDYYNNVVLIGNDTGALYIESLSYNAQKKQSEQKIFSNGQYGNMELVIAFNIINKNEYYINTISYSQEDYEKELRTIDERYTVWKDWEKP